jgi:hypothetical protein
MLPLGLNPKKRRKDLFFSFLATRNSASFSSFQPLFEVYGARGIFPKESTERGRLCKDGLREEEI